MQKKQGISLIVLVITIIVMIILAAAIVITLNNSNIINKSNEAVDATDKAQLKNIAALAWADAYTARLEDSSVNLKAQTIANIRAAGITTTQLPTKYIKVYEKGVIIVGIDVPKHEGIIPEGGTYIKGIQRDEYGDMDYATGTHYTAGDEFPVLEKGDIYMYGDFIYGYQAYTEGGLNWYTDLSDITGWGVKIADADKKEYNDMLIIDSINGEPITSLHRTFSTCSNVEKISFISIPDTITDMRATFMDDTYLVSITGLEIPNGVTTMSGTFISCTELPTLNNLVIPASVNNLESTFCGCTSLAGTITIHANPTNYDMCFEATSKAIKIVGDCSEQTKQNLSGTANEGNVTY